MGGGVGFEWRCFLSAQGAFFWYEFFVAVCDVFVVYLGMRPTPRTLAILLLGLAGVLLGITFKLNHLMGAHTLFNVGVVVTVVGVVLWVIQLVRGEAK